MTANSERSAVAAESKPVLLLHVNDDTDDQILFQAACGLARVPFTWHVVDSAEKAISYLEALVSRSKIHDVCWPSLVVLDIVMPGISGFAVLSHIRTTAELAGLPVVIFTGAPCSEFENLAQRLGANAFIEKPMRFEETTKKVAEIYEMWAKNDWPLSGSALGDAPGAGGEGSA